MQTLLLDPAAWDLSIDASGNIAVASEPGLGVEPNEEVVAKYLVR